MTQDGAAGNDRPPDPVALQAATIEVLKAMSASPGNEQQVLELIARRAREFCSAEVAAIFTYDGQTISISHVSARDIAAFDPYAKTFPRAPGRDITIGRAILEGRMIEIDDADADPDLGAVVHAHRYRTIVSLPFVLEGRIVGAMTIAVRAPGGLADIQLALVKTFAEQASIAIGSAATFRQLQDRTAALAARNSEFGERIEQQNATIDVLKAMSATSGDPQPVFKLIVRRALELCSSTGATLFEFDGEMLHLRAVETFDGVPPHAFIRQFPMRPDNGTMHGRAVLQRRIIHVRNADADNELNPTVRALGLKSMLSVPLLHEGRPIGTMSIGVPTPGGFSDSQVALLQTFAEQAVIAIRSAAIFRQLQTRTEDLTEALQQQTATADVLKAISRSAFDLDTVLTTLISTALRLCNARYGQIFRREGDVYRYAASQMEVDPAYQDYEQHAEIRAGRGTLVGRVALEERVVLIDDAWNDPDYAEKEVAHLGGVRAMLGVPLLRDGELIGAFALARGEPIAFTPRQVELVTTFADQAVIAIENVRLFDEVQARTRDLAEALEIQSATADVLKAISRSAFDLDTVLDTLTRSAANLCDASTGVIFVRDGERFRRGASFGQTPEFARYWQSAPLVPGRNSVAARVALSQVTEHFVDIQAEPDFDPRLLRVTSIRAALGVPLLRDGKLEGVFVLGRTRPEPFTQRQIELVQTFADQALIAIENVRLFDEVQARTRELAASLEDLRTAQDRLIQTEKLASLGQLTAGIAHEIKNPLNFVNNFSALSAELIDELGTVLSPAALDKPIRAEIEELMGMLKGNLEKVVHHGQRADAIVKNMLLHSREGGGERRSVDLNATVDEALNLAYHGARAEKPGFNITLERHFDPAVGAVEIFPQEFIRVLLNLISNGFYAATSRKNATPGAGFEPTLSVTTEARQGEITIRVRDNGTGIPEAARPRLFEPFFTTKPAGEGTGLGLSLSHDIITKQHNGRITVDSRVDEFTEFTITLPRPAAGAQS